MKRRSDEATKRRRGGTGNLPVIGDPCRVVGFRTIDRDFLGRAVHNGTVTEMQANLTERDGWKVTWANKQVVYLPRIESVLSLATSAGCDTITIERSRRRS